MRLESIELSHPEFYTDKINVIDYMYFLKVITKLFSCSDNSGAESNHVLYFM